MALSRRTGQRFQGSIWPGFVDAVTGLLMVLVFVLTIFMVMQFVLRETISGHRGEREADGVIGTALAQALGMERQRSAELADQVGSLGATLDEAQLEPSDQSALIDSLRADLGDREAALTAAQSRISDFEAQVAALIAQRDEAQGVVADLRGERAELLNEQEALNAALVQARDELDEGAEAQALEAARREALEALISDLRARNADAEGTVARLTSDLEGVQEALTEEEAARLAEAEAAAALRARLEEADTELTAMTMALEAERERAEETLTLLAAAREAEEDLNSRLAQALLAREDTQGNLAAALLARDAAQDDCAAAAPTLDGLIRCLEQAQQGREVTVTQLTELQEALARALADADENAAEVDELRVALSETEAALATARGTAAEQLEEVQAEQAALETRLAQALAARQSTLDESGIHRDWLERALAFDGLSAEARVRWLAGRLAAHWQRREGLGDGARMARFDLTLPEDFPLNLVDGLCPVALPPADWGDEQVLDALRPVGERVCLLLGANPEQRARLSRRCRSEGNWWVAPDDGELSALLLAPQPLEALSRLIADYVKVARISPYQTGGGVQKEAVFFGRDQLLSHIQHREPANYLLVGGRQLGKSSLLLALQRRYAKDPAVDCRYASLGLDPIPQLALALGLPVDTGVQRVLKAVGDVAPGRRRLLLLDEADVFVARDAAGVLGEARGAPYACLNAFRSYSDAGRCHFILAGFWQLYRSASLEYHSPIKNFAETLTVGALEPDACRALIREPLAALNLRLAADALVERMVAATGRRANLIAILCNEMLKETRLATRTLGEADLERAMDSRALRSALDAWSELTTDPAAARLDRIICYALVEREDFSFAEVLDVLDGIGAGAVCAADIGVAAVRTADPTRAPASPEAIKASLTRLEIAFIIGRSDGRYFWQVPLWREQVQAEEPARLLAAELG